MILIPLLQYKLNIVDIDSKNLVLEVRYQPFILNQLLDFEMKHMKLLLLKERLLQHARKKKIKQNQMDKARIQSSDDNMVCMNNFGLYYRLFEKKG